MTDEAPLDWELSAQQRARRGLAWERNRKRLLVALIVAVVLAIAGGAVWAWQSDSLDDGPAPRAQRHSDVPSTIGTTIRLECRAPLTVNEPLRLWIAGDSLAGTLGPALGDMTGETGVVAPTFDTHTSSGLVSPGFFNWPERATEEIARIDPEVVVFIIGANDTSITRDETLDENGQPAWRTRYGLLMEEMLRIMGSEGRSVIWIGPPTLRDEGKNDGARDLGIVARDIVSFHARTTYIDAFKLFSDEHGEFTPTLPGLDGEPVRVRASDGIHFTPAGGRYLAANVFNILDRRCHIEEQADPSHPQPVHESPGSGGPTGEESGPPRSNGGSPPATAPPPTAPPPTPPPTAPPTTLISLPISNPLAARSRH